MLSFPVGNVCVNRSYIQQAVVTKSPLQAVVCICTWMHISKLSIQMLKPSATCVSICKYAHRQNDQIFFFFLSNTQIVYTTQAIT